MSRSTLGHRRRQSFSRDVKAEDARRGRVVLRRTANELHLGGEVNGVLSLRASPAALHRRALRRSASSSYVDSERLRPRAERRAREHDHVDSRNVVRRRLSRACPMFSCGGCRPVWDSRTLCRPQTAHPPDRRSNAMIRSFVRTTG